MGTDQRSAITNGFETAQCIHLEDKHFVNEDFFKCGVIHELLPGERVTELCQTKIWRKCEYIYDPTRAHREGKWSDIVGLDVVKKELVQKVQHPLLFYKKYSDTGVLPQKAILLFGPDGCGKARLSKVLAHESGAHLENLIPREIDRLKTIIQEATEPTIVFLDEVDMVAQPVEYFQQRSLPLARDPVLVLMDSIETLEELPSPVVLIMATDNPKLILRTLLKQDYIPEILYVPPPTLQEREKLIRKFLKNRPLAADVDFQRLAELTRDFSILDIKKFIRNLELEWLENSFKKPQPVEITMEQLVRQIKDVVPSLSNALISQYEQAAKRWGAMEEELRRKREKRLTWDDIGGYEDVKEQLKDVLAVLEEENETVSQYNLKPPKGIILYGPPGCGKTYIVNVLASITKANFHSVTAGALLSKWYGEAEQNITELFATAKVDPPSIIFFDELEGLFQTRGEASPVHSRVVSVFLQELSNLTPEDRVIVIGATNRPQDVDVAFLRPGRFDEMIGIGLPDFEARKRIFEVHSKDMPLDKDVNFDMLAEKTDMFTGAEIAFICDTARKAVAKEAMKSGFRNIKMEDFLDPILQAKPGLTEDDVRQFNEAQERFGRRKYAPKKLIEKEKTLTWDDIGGYNEVKGYMKNLVKILESEELLERYGLKPPKGLLLYGPPGCGKSYLSKVLAAETEANFKVISAGIMMSKWYGETEKQIHDLFVQARRNPPTILFFDELEGLFTRREALGAGFAAHKTPISTLLTELSELKPEDRVLVIGATNRPQDIDPAFLRPGRFDERIGIDPPDLQARKAIFEVHTRNMPLAKDVDFDFLALKTEKYTGAEIEYICNQTRRAVAIEALQSTGFRKVKMEDFLAQIAITKPGLSEEDIRLFQEAQERFERQLISTSKQKVWEDVSFEDIGGLSEAKEFLKNYTGFLVKHFDEIRTSGLSSGGGVILFGPPGCGKTLLAKAAVRDTKVNFFKFSALELRITPDGFNKFSDMLRDAEKVSPSIILLDDLESTKSHITQDIALFVASELEKIPNEAPLIVLCETINLEGIPEVLKDLNRIEYVLPVPPPNAEARKEILKIKTKKLALEKDVDFDILAKRTKYFTGADLEKFCREALRVSFTKQAKRVYMEDFIDALSKVDPTLTEEAIQHFKRTEVQQNKYPLRKHITHEFYS
ncbi:MAG: AAA family ATPase [Promethearchaeota archaeon]